MTTISRLVGSLLVLLFCSLACPTRQALIA